MNDETDTVIELKYSKEQGNQFISNGRARTLKLVGEDYLAWNSYRVSVIRAADGSINHLSLDSNRIKNVKFHPKQ